MNIFKWTLPFWAFLGKTFCDARGVPDGGRVTQFVCIVLVVAMAGKGIILGKYGPLSYFAALLGVAVTGSVTGLFENKAKIAAEAAIAIGRAKAEAGLPDSAPTVGTAAEVNMTAAP